MPNRNEPIVGTGAGTAMRPVGLSVAARTAPWPIRKTAHFHARRFRPGDQGWLHCPLEWQNFPPPLPELFTIVRSPHDISHSRPDGQRHPRPQYGRRRESQIRPPRRPHGHGRHGRCAMEPPFAPQPGQPQVVRPRPFRALQRPRLHAPVRAVAPHRLRPAHGRVEELPPVGQQNGRTPRIWRHTGRRNHHRPAGPGPGQRRGHGASRKIAGGRIQPPRF